MKILRVPKERFSEAEFFDFLVLARKASDNRMKCKYGHTPRVGYIIEQLKPVDGGATPVEQPAFRTPKLEEIWDAAIVVSVFLHDVGMATLAGKDIHSATPPLCNDEFESSGKTSISKKTWRSWLFENVKLQEGSVKRFVAHLDQRFPIIKEWASQAGASAEFFSETTDPGGRLINAAQWVREYPEQAEQLWRRKNHKATLRENAPVYKRTGSRHAWLSTYLDTSVVSHSVWSLIDGWRE